METIVITPDNKEQATKIKAFLSQMGIKAGKLTEEEKEDIGLLRAMNEGEKNKRNVSLPAFLKNLRK
jgi:hypothetical protein